MGGSRCTYRNCTVRSDGVVHMFHYPVFDKARCHQWLVNAHRFDFLNLKLSQVRNRVVCQHHFKDECFMNYLKDKLTFDAIPTENGPYCKSAAQDSNSNPEKMLPDDQIAKAYSVVINENEECEKYSKIYVKTDPSTIYADYLTNGDAWEKKSLNETIWNNMVVASKNRNDNRITIEWLPDDIKEDNQKSLLTLDDLIGDNGNTKITEFENPLLANVTVNQNKDIDNAVVAITHEKPKTSKSREKIGQLKTVTSQLKTVTGQQEGKNAMLKQESSFVLSNHQLDNLIESQENNIIVTFESLVGSNTGTNEKGVDVVIRTEQDIDTFNNKNNISLTGTPLQLVTGSNDYNAIIQNPNELVVQDESRNVLAENEFNNFVIPGPWNEDQTTNKQNATKKPKVMILSEKTISDPVMFQGQFEPLSPSAYIHLPKKMKPVTESQIKHETCDVTIEEINSTEFNSVEQAATQLTDINKTNNKNGNKPCVVVAKPSVPKLKIAPERVAAIEKKRNFNKRLRDIIANCLENLDDQGKSADEVKDNQEGNIKEISSDQDKILAEVRHIKNTVSKEPQRRPMDTKKENLKKSVGTYLSKEAGLPNAQEYMMKFLDDRMKKMEETLLCKIEQNSKRIVELKQSIPRSGLAYRATGTQTQQNQESYKRQLYKEISQFLSPNANTLVYEELFIKKYNQKLSNHPSPSKKRKLRCY